MMDLWVFEHVSENASMNTFCIPYRDPSTFSEGTWTLQTYIRVSPIIFGEGTWIPRDLNGFGVENISDREGQERGPL